jgi:hypothetical protein
MALMRKLIFVLAVLAHPPRCHSIQPPRRLSKTGVDGTLAEGAGQAGSARFAKRRIPSVQRVARSRTPRENGIGIAPCTRATEGSLIVHPCIAGASTVRITASSLRLNAA